MPCVVFWIYWIAFGIDWSSIFKYSNQHPSVIVTIRFLLISSPLPLSSPQASSPKAASSLSLSRYCQLCNQSSVHLLPACAQKQLGLLQTYHFLLEQLDWRLWGAPNSFPPDLHHIRSTLLVGSETTWLFPNIQSVRRIRRWSSQHRIIFVFPIFVLQIEKVAWIWVIAFAFAAPQVTKGFWNKDFVSTNSDPVLVMVIIVCSVIAHWQTISLKSSSQSNKIESP